MSENGRPVICSLQSKFALTLYDGQSNMSGLQDMRRPDVVGEGRCGMAGYSRGSPHAHSRCQWWPLISSRACSLLQIAEPLKDQIDEDTSMCVKAKASGHTSTILMARFLLYDLSLKCEPKRSWCIFRVGSMRKSLQITRSRRLRLLRFLRSPRHGQQSERSQWSSRAPR